MTKDWQPVSIKLNPNLGRVDEVTLVFENRVVGENTKGKVEIAAFEASTKPLSLSDKKSAAPQKEAVPAPPEKAKEPEKDGAELTPEGFKKAQKELESLKEFIKAYLKSQGYLLIDQGWLEGFAPWYRNNRSFREFTDELDKKLEALEKEGVLMEWKPGSMAPPAKPGHKENARAYAKAKQSPEAMEQFIQNHLAFEGYRVLDPAWLNRVAAEMAAKKGGQSRLRDLKTRLNSKRLRQLTRAGILAGVPQDGSIDLLQYAPASFAGISLPTDTFIAVRSEARAAGEVFSELADPPIIKGGTATATSGQVTVALGEQEEIVVTFNGMRKNLVRAPDGPTLEDQLGKVLNSEEFRQNFGLPDSITFSVALVGSQPRPADPTKLSVWIEKQRSLPEVRITLLKSSEEILLSQEVPWRNRGALARALNQFINEASPATRSEARAEELEEALKNRIAVLNALGTHILSNKLSPLGLLELFSWPNVDRDKKEGYVVIVRSAVNQFLQFVEEYNDQSLEFKNVEFFRSQKDPLRIVTKNADTAGEGFHWTEYQEQKNSLVFFDPVKLAQQANFPGIYLKLKNAADQLKALIDKIDSYFESGQNEAMNKAIAKALAIRTALINDLRQDEQKAVEALEQINPSEELAIGEKRSELRKTAILGGGELPAGLLTPEETVEKLRAETRFTAGGTTFEAGKFEAGKTPAIFSSPVLVPSGAGAVPQPFPILLQRFGWESDFGPRIAVRTIRELFEVPLVDVRLSPEAAEALLAIIAESLSQTVESKRSRYLELLKTEVFAKDARFGGMLHKGANAPGAHVLILDHVPTSQEVAGLVLPLFFSRNAFLKIVLIPEAADAQENEEYLSRVEKLKELFPNGRAEILNPVFAFDETILNLHETLYHEMQKFSEGAALPVSAEQFANNYFVFSYSESLKLRLEPLLGRLVNIKPAEIRYQIEPANQAVLLSVVSLGAVRFAQRVLSRDQNMFVREAGTNRYWVDEDRLRDFAASLQAAIQAHERIFGSA